MNLGAAYNPAIVIIAKTWFSRLTRFSVLLREDRKHVFPPSSSFRWKMGKGSEKRGTVKSRDTMTNAYKNETPNSIFYYYIA
jgi:hypothetical protein